MFTVNSVAGPLGAELHGVDLTQKLTNEILNDIRSLLVEHQVIFFETKL
jgi:taurine dioxygenase